MAQISAKAVKELRDQTGAGMMDCKKVLADADGDLKKAVELLRERGLAKAGKREGRATSEGGIAIALSGAAGGIVEVGCETDFVARTDAFIELVDSLAAVVAADAGVDSPDKLLAADLGGEKVGDKITNAINTLGENVVVKRVAHVASSGGIVGGYVHAGGKLGVLVALDGVDAGQADLAKDVAMHVAAADPTPVAVDRGGVPAELLEGERKIYRAQAEQDGKPEKIIDRIVDGKLAKFVSEIALVEQAYVKDSDKKVGDVLKEAAEGASVNAFLRFKLGEADEA